MNKPILVFGRNPEQTSITPQVRCALLRSADAATFITIVVYD